jgi:hypothetical protein
MLALRSTPTTTAPARSLAETLNREQKQKDEDDPRRPASASAKRLGAAAAKLCIIGLSPRTDGKSYRIKR